MTAPAADSSEASSSVEKVVPDARPVARESSMTVQEVFEVPKLLQTQLSALSDKDGRNSPVPPTTTATTPATNNTPITNRRSYRSQISVNTTATSTSVTYGGQTELPPLPIPSLDETLNKFLACLEALQEDEEQRVEAQQIVLDFMKGDGPKLQELLLDYDRKGRDLGEIGSYVEEFWNDSYLAPDSSVVLNLNPFFVLEDSPDPKIARDPIRRAASLCFASVKLASQLRSENLRPDTHRGKPLCMDQFRSLFGTSRVPMKKSKDAINVYDKSNHVLVMCRSQLFYFQALWPDGDCAVDEGDLIDILTAIHSHAEEMDPVETARSAIGVLTSLSRKEWAIAREEMISSNPKNEENLRIIDSALFVLVLDDYIPKNKHDAAANMLHGSYELKYSPELKADYQAGSCCNRWYDKLQIIVCGDGTAGINFEHSAIDGHTALRFVSDVYAETVISFAQSITKLVQAHDTIPNVINAKVRRAAVNLDSAGRTTLDVFPKAISFNLPQSVKSKIYYAETALGDEIVASDTQVLEFKEYGKLFIVNNKLSPDSFVQMSMMLAYYKLYGRIVCAYEPVLTKSFFHGRTEAMRPATMEAKHLCETFCNPKSNSESKLAALRNATRVHSQLVKECARGKGVDRHLFSLKCIAEKNKLPTPAFFRSKPWQMLNHTILSTSNCGNPSLALFGFGPVVPDGLGIGYIIKDSSVYYSISSKHRQTKRYAFTLNGILKEMGSLLKNASPTSVVDTHRASLKSIPRHMISYDSYGDIWGESTPPPSPKTPKAVVNPVPTAPAGPVVPSIPALSVPAAPVVVPITTPAPGAATTATTATTVTEETPQNENTGAEDDEGGSGQKPARRWAAETQAGVTSDDELEFDDEDGEEVVVSLESDEKKEKDSKNRPKLKRRGSNDLMPVVPCRRSSMMKGARRQASFEYSELSQKGESIDMAKKKVEESDDEAAQIADDIALLELQSQRKGDKSN